MKYAVLLFLLSSSLYGQSPAAASVKRCDGPNPSIAVTVPVAVGANLIPVQMCVGIGAGLTVDTSVSPPRLIATPPVQTAPPRAVVHKVSLKAVAPPAGTDTVNVTLQYTPHAQSPVIVAFNGSRVGVSVVDAVMPGGGAAPKTVILSVPPYRPFEDGDVVTLVYWTNDPS